jgi:chemotaxis protein CheC
MELTLGKKDALTELINIGYGRAAGALSELTGYRITLEVPQVAIHEIETIGPVLEETVGPVVASVSQVFMGPISGNALLLLSEASAVALSQLLAEQPAENPDLDVNAKEVVTEIGNILLNACIGVFGNLLHLQITFAVPRMSVDQVQRLFQHLDPEAEKVRYGLMIHTRFKIKTGNVTGYLVIVLGITSLDRLMIELDKWEKRQLHG